MDVFSDPLIETVVIMSSAQIGKTEVLNNVLGFYIDQDPAPILIVQPTLDMAQSWSKDRLANMLRDTPRLRGKVQDPRSRDSGNTVLHKQFAGGHLTVVGSNSASGLASRPIRIVLCDEVDKYEPSTSGEGDPVTLATARTATFWNRKVLLTSTPHLKGLSRIEDEWNKSDQRRFYVACLHCGHRQALMWKHLRWEDGKPETAAYACAACGGLHEEQDKGKLLATGMWVVENPGPRIAGFHLNALYSPWRRWADLAVQWLGSQHSLEQLQAFVTQVLGEPWEERGGGLDPDDLTSRREAYAAEVPAGVGLLTAGVDVQDDRLEVIVRGWGHGEESWLITRAILLGDPSGESHDKTKPSVWAQLDSLLRKEWQHESGETIRVNTTCVDSGAHTDAVYRFCKPRYGFRIFATKGYSGPAHPIVNHKPSTNNKGRVRLFFVGTDAAKDSIYGRLKIATAGPQHMHFPLVDDEDYFDQLVAEKVVKQQINGRWVRRYKLPRGKRNEVLDCEVLALVALELSSARKEQLGALARRLGGAKPLPVPEPPPTTMAAEKLKKMRRTPKRRNWINDY